MLRMAEEIAFKSATAEELVMAEVLWAKSRISKFSSKEFDAVLKHARTTGIDCSCPYAGVARALVSELRGLLGNIDFTQFIMRYVPR